MSSKPIDELKVKVTADFGDIAKAAEKAGEEAGAGLVKGIESQTERLGKVPVLFGGKTREELEALNKQIETVGASAAKLERTDFTGKWEPQIAAADAGLKRMEATYGNIIKLHEQLSKAPATTQQGQPTSQGQIAGQMGSLIDAFQSKQINWDTFIQKMAEVVPLANKQGEAMGKALAEGFDGAADKGTSKAVDKIQKNLDKLKNAAQATGATLVNSLQSFARNPSIGGFATLVQNMSRYAQASKAYTAAQQQATGTTSALGQAAGGAGGGIGSLTNVVAQGSAGISGLSAVAIAGAAALVGLGLAAVGAFKVIAAAIPAGYELINTQSRLVIALRAAQREMGTSVGSIAEWGVAIDGMVDKFKLLDKADVTQAASQAIVLGRQFDYSAEQMKQWLEIAGTMAVFNNTTMTESIKGMSNAMASNYNRALVQLGISFGPFERKQKSVTLGFGDSWEAMTEAQRAAVNLSLAYEHLGGIQHDLAIMTDTAAGKVEASSKRMQTAAQNLGKSWADVASWIKVAANNIGTAIATLLTRSDPALDDILIKMAKAGQLSKTSANLVLGGMYQARTVVTKAELAAAQAQLDAAANALDNFGNKAKALTTIDITALTDQFKDLADVALKLGEDLAAADASWMDKDYQIWSDHWTKIVELSQEHADREKEITDDYNQSVADANADYARNYARAEEDFNRSQAKAAEDYYRSRAENAADFQESQAREEADFQKEMRRLTEDYASDISDAMRKRDARAILDLTKNYLKEKGRRTEDYEERRKQEQADQAKSEARAEAAYQRQRKDAEEAYERQKKDLSEALGRQLAEMEAAWRKQLATEDKNFEKQKKAADDARDEARKANDVALAAQKKQLEDNFAERLKDWIAHAVLEGTMSEKTGAAVLESLGAYFDLDEGTVAKMMKDFYALLKANSNFKIVIDTIYNGVVHNCGPDEVWDEGLGACKQVGYQGGGTHGGATHPACGADEVWDETLGACKQIGYQGGGAHGGQPSCKGDEFWDGVSCRKISDVVGSSGNSPYAGAFGGTNISEYTGIQSATKQVNLQFTNALRVEGPGVNNDQAFAMADLVMRNLATIIREESRA